MHAYIRSVLRMCACIRKYRYTHTLTRSLSRWGYMLYISGLPFWFDAITTTIKHAAGF